MPCPRFWTKEKLLSLKILYDSGLSMQEVGVKLGKSVWAISSIMKRRHLIRRPASMTNNIKFRNSPLSFQPKLHITQAEERLKVAGLMLYWGEGGKKGINGIDFANSDPQMISLFIKFLRQIYQPTESKFRVYLYSYNSLPAIELINYWSKLTNIPEKQFTKPYIRTKSEQKHDKMPHGLIHIRYHDKRLLELVLSDLEKIKCWDGRVDKYTTL